MIAKPTVDAVLVAIDRWTTVSTLLGVIALLGFLPATRSRCYGLWLPAALLFMRKLALFIPVPGALSTYDRATFWSLGAVFYFLIILLLHVLAQLAVRRSSHLVAAIKKLLNSSDLGPGLFVVALLLSIPAALSEFFLPIDGVSHFYTVFVCFLALPKILLVHPLLLPLTAGAFLVQAWLAVFASGGGAARELNRLLLLLLVILGFVRLPFLAQSSTNLALELRVKGWEWSMATEERETGVDTENFLSSWAGNLKPIEDCGVNYVARDQAEQYQDCRIRSVSQSVPDVSVTFLMKRWHWILLGATLIPAAFVSAARRPNQQSHPGREPTKV